MGTYSALGQFMLGNLVQGTKFKKQYISIYFKFWKLILKCDWFENNKGTSRKFDSIRSIYPANMFSLITKIMWGIGLYYMNGLKIFAFLYILT